MKIIDMPEQFETLQDYVMKDNDEKIETISIDKDSKFNRCWCIKNTKKSVRRLYGSIINGSKETILSLEYMMLMKMHVVIGYYELDVNTRKLSSQIEMYKLDDIEFDKVHIEEINELIRLFKNI